MSKQVDLVVTLISKPGMEAEVHAELEALSEASQKEPGCVRYELAKSTDQEGVFYLIEQWESEEALALHRTYDHYINGTTKLKPMYSSTSIHRVNWA